MSKKQEQENEQMGRSSVAVQLEGVVKEPGGSDIRVVQVRTNQNDFWSVDAHISREEEQNGIAEVHREWLENNCEDRQEDQHHKEFHIENSSVLTTGEEKKDSTFKSDSPQLSDVCGLKAETLPPSMEAQQAPLKEDKGVSGIANMRNTCYMNAALQALRHNTEISAFFLENRYKQWIEKKSDSPKVELVKAYGDLLRSLWSASKPAYVRPSGFIQSMIPAANQAGFEQFQVPLQHDSHEFLTFLLDQLHEGMAEEVAIEINRPTPITEQDKTIHNALEAWKRFFGKQYSPFTEMIYGLFRITLTCQTCKNKSDSWETFNCLKLPFPASDTPVSFDQMLKEEFKEETIEGYACTKCHPGRTTATRKTCIWRLPRMVVLSLKRFTPDGRKLYTKFEMKNEPVVFQEFFSPESPEPSKYQAYEPFATVDHHGSTGGGHYTAQAKSPLTEKWHLFDDETACSISEPQFGISTYILFLKPSLKAYAKEA
jgi:ubiquitin C-terminal hydrolase